MQDRDRPLAAALACIASALFVGLPGVTSLAVVLAASDTPAYDGQAYAQAAG